MKEIHHAIKSTIAITHTTQATHFKIGGGVGDASTLVAPQYNPQQNTHTKRKNPMTFIIGCEKISSKCIMIYDLG